MKPLLPLLKFCNLFVHLRELIAVIILTVLVANAAFLCSTIYSHITKRLHETLQATLSGQMHGVILTKQV